jgi:hypothetical protein
MNLFILLMIISATTFGYLAAPHPEGSTASDILPAVLRFVPEAMAVIVAALVVFLGVRNRFQYVRPVYWLLFGGLALVFASSAVANSVEPGPLFASMRTYLRALPLFFLPAVIEFREKRFRSQFLLVLILAYLQVPLALEQRSLTVARGGITGDHATGTLIDSGILSIFLTAVACVLTAFYLRKQLRLSVYIVALLVVLVPTMVNETKAMVVLLPLGIGVTFVLAERGLRRIVLAVKAILVLVVFAAIFIPVYDHYESDRFGVGIVEWFTDEHRVSDYMITDASATEQRWVRRGDALVTPFRSFRESGPVHFAFGYGPGNVSDSALGDQFDGYYHAMFARFLQTTWTIVALELGLLGFALLALLMWCLYQDALVLVRRDRSVVGVFALGWAGVIALVVFSLFYNTMINSAPMSYLFWYFAGVVAAQRMRFEVAQAAQRVQKSIPAGHPVYG